MQSTSKAFFCQKIGPTLEILAFLSQNKQRQLLKQLSKSSSKFYQTHKDQINSQFCSLRAIESVKVSQKTVFEKNLAKESILKVFHVSGSIFLITYRTFRVELVDIERIQGDETDYKPIKSYVFDLLNIADDKIPWIQDVDVVVKDHDGENEVEILKTKQIWIVASTFNREFHIIDFNTSRNFVEQQAEPQVVQMMFIKNMEAPGPYPHCVSMIARGKVDIFDSSKIADQQLLQISEWDPSQMNMNKPLSKMIELERFDTDLTKTTIAFTVQGKKLNLHELGIYEYFGDISSTSNKKTLLKIQDEAVPESIVQIQKSYIAVSTIKGIEIFDLKAMVSVNKINIPQPFLQLIRVNPSNYDFTDFGQDFGMTCLGFSYKNLFKVGIHSDKEEADSVPQKKLQFVGDILAMNQHEYYDANGKYKNELYYTLREDNGAFYKIDLLMA